MPDKVKYLLVHDSDMTYRLQDFFGDEIHLRVLNASNSNGKYCREVILVLNESEKPVEFGAIRIHLEHFAEQPREVILEGYRPLGAILHDFKVDFESHPSVYFQVKPDEIIQEALGIEYTTYLYGRCNTLTNPAGDPLAEVVEILPPIEES